MPRSIAAIATTRTSITLPALLVVVTIFFFLPTRLYLYNAAEFRAPLSGVLLVMVPAAVLAFAVLAVIGIALRGVGRQVYAAILVALGVALWVQGYLVVWDYGVLDGRFVDWAQYEWPNTLDLVVWLLLLGTALFVSRRVAAIAPAVAIFFLTLQVVATAVDLASVRRPSAAERGSRELANRSLIFSRDLSIVHIILDGFQADVFGQLVADRAFDRGLDGFVWFRNTVGGFPTTFMSMPYIFAAQTYDNRTPPGDFFAKAMGEGAFYNELEHRGYGVHLVPSWPVRQCLGDYTSCYVIRDPYDAPRGARLHAALRLLDLSLFRALPHVLKPYIYNDQQWRLQPLYPLARPDGVLFNHLEFMRDYRARMRVGDVPPTYHFVHLLLPHYPVVSDAECRGIGVQPETPAAYRGQAACALRTFIQLLDRLRELGIYDSSLIVLQSDHGVGQEVATHGAAGDGAVTSVPDRAVGLALALLAVKLPGAHGGLRISDAPMTAADVGRIVRRAGGNDAKVGELALADDMPAERERVFHFYQWRHEHWRSDSLGPIQEYLVDGDVYDRRAWREGRLLFPASDSTLRPEIDLGTSNAVLQLAQGWGQEEVVNDGTTVAWALAPSAAVVLPQPTTPRARLSARLLGYPGRRGTQRVEVRIDGATVGTWEIPPEQLDLREYQLDVPVTAAGAPCKIELVFDSHFQPSPGDRERRPLGVLLDWIRLEPAA